MARQPGTSRIHLKNGMRLVDAIQEVHNDSIFFHKSQIRVGTNLRHFGRLNPNTTWCVTSITTYSARGGRMRFTAANEVHHMSDDITLVCNETHEARSCTFGYLSYSAIWRL